MKKTILLSITAAALALQCGLSYGQTVVNASATPRQTFKYFGVNSLNEDSRTYSMPAAIRDEMLRMQYEGLKTNAVRIWGGPGALDNAKLAYYKDFVMAKEIPLGLEFFYIVGGPGEHEPGGFNYYNYGKDLANFVKNSRDRGLKIDGIGWNNEPSMNQDYVGVAPENAFRISSMPQVAKGFRDQRNALSLAKVKFVMGDYANSDGWFGQAVNTITADADAMSAIDAFAVHSYSNSPDKGSGDKILAAGKDFHQNESADGDGESNTGDAGENYRCIARYLNDLNHGVSDWYWFIGIHGKNMRDLGNGQYDSPNENLKIAMINYAPNLGKIIAFPRYYFFKHINSVLDKGTVIRACTGQNGADIGWIGSSGGHLNGIKLASVVGKRPDGRMVVVLSSENAQTININIAELAGSGSKTFSVVRSKLGSYEQNGGTINANNGAISIQAGAMEIITLLENSGPPVAVTGISLQPATVAVGGTVTLKPVFAPANATNTAVSYVSSNTAVATVSAAGVVTGVSIGSATITATTADGNKTATSAITVTAAPPKTMYEAEDGTFGIDARVQDATNASNGKLIGNMNTIGTFSQVSSVNGGTGGTATLVIRYANGFGANSIVSLYVNGIDVGQITFTPTGDWNTFGDVTKTITLVAGANNTIKLQKDANDVSAADIDKYTVNPTIITGFSDESSTVSELNIYPNPSRSQFTVSLNNQSFDLQIFNADGTEVLKQTVRGSFTNESTFAAGVYVVKTTTTNGNTQVRKLVIQ